MILASGSWALRIACVVALATSLFALIGARPKIHWALRCCRWLAVAQAALLGVAYACLTVAFVTNDFSSAYVAANSNTQLPLIYRITALWGEHEGSLFLWLCLLGAWTATVACAGRRLPDDLQSSILGVLGLVAAMFGGFVAWTADPFVPLPMPPTEGSDLNPLLQNLAMAVHPPLLYAGYASSAVPFAFAVATLLTGQTARAGFSWLRPFTTAGWLLLTLGIVVGSYWSYAELGWGGWWFWDPVENASLMPWLVSTALIHSLAVAARRGAFRNWTLLLSIAVFSLSLVGTFITRAGLVASVHSFATAPDRGQLLLTGFGLLVLGALLLHALRAKRLEPVAGFRPISRESFLLINNILLTAAAAMVFVGTFYPVLGSPAGLSVGAPYYDTVLLPPILALLLAVGVGMHAAWGRAAPSRLLRRMRWPLGIAVSAGIGLPFVVFGANTMLAALGVTAGVGVIGSAAMHRCAAGMRVAHAGLGLMVIGITISTSFGLQADRRLHAGRPAELGAYEFQLIATRVGPGPNYTATEATIDIHHAGRLVSTVTPQKRRYVARGTVMSEAGIDSRWHRDLYVVLGQDFDGRVSAARLQYRPLIRLIWLGGVVMALGGLIAIAGRCRRHDDGDRNEC